MKKLLFCAMIALAFISCENNPELYGDYNVVGSTFESSDECFFEDDLLINEATVTVTFTKTEISLYYNGELKETQSYTRESKKIIRYNSIINNEVIIEIEPDENRIIYEGYYFAKGEKLHSFFLLTRKL